MIITRRSVLRSALAAPFIVPRRSSGMMRGGLVAAPSTLIPLSAADPRFASNTNGGGGAGTFLTSGSTVNNMFWNNNATYTDGNPCWSWGGTSGVLNVNKSWVDWREGPRIIADGGTMNMDQCFINCVGKTGDHADGAQWFQATGTAAVNITNTCFRSYTDAEALSKYGAGFIGSDAIFSADDSTGSISFNNCLFWGGDRGVTINVDVGTMIVSMTNCFFAMSPNQVPYGCPNGQYGFLIQPTGGSLVIGAWSNNFDATVSGSTITPFNAIPAPTSAGLEWPLSC